MSHHSTSFEAERKVPVEAAQELHLVGHVEVDDHVAARDDVERSAHRPGIEQVELVERDHAAQLVGDPPQAAVDAGAALKEPLLARAIGDRSGEPRARRDSDSRMGTSALRGRIVHEHAHRRARDGVCGELDH